MEITRFDSIAKQFAERRISRRRAIQEASVGVVAGAIAAGEFSHVAAQEASPVASDGTAEPEYLFLQSFQQGSIAPKEGEDGKYTLTLEQGLGQTVFFSGRPERKVGTSPTAEFLKGFGFSPDNPPNAALVLETSPGDTDIAVLELINPTYDEATRTATYEVQLLKQYEETLQLGFTEQPIDLSKLPPSFGAAHLFIDDCADGNITCTTSNTHYPCPGDGICGSFPSQGYCYSWSSPGCYPCDPYHHLNPSAEQVYQWWENKCNSTFAVCQTIQPGYPNGCTANFNN